MTPERMIELFIDRWGLELTFEETREHLGVETQRQWSDLAIARSMSILMANQLRQEELLFEALLTEVHWKIYFQ